MKVILSSLSVLFFLLACSSNNESKNTLPLDSESQKISYLLGAQNAGQLLQDPNFAKYNHENIVKGFEAGLKDASSFDAACQNSIQSLFGQTQNEFNAQYVDEASTCIGKFLGSMFKEGWEQAKYYKTFDEKYLVYGFKLGLNKVDTLIDNTTKESMMKSFMDKVNVQLMKEVTAFENDFFGKIKKINGIQELTNGIYLETVSAGNGESPTATSDVKAHYVLMNTHGDTLQSSLANPTAPVFNLGGVIPGWTIGIPAMKKGGKYKLYVPQNMAYGKDSPDPRTIPPYSTLVFYVELQDFGPAGKIK
jgi:FKBP-type peptidyl-prolyl cis-trans isomerase